MRCATTRYGPRFSNGQSSKPTVEASERSQFRVISESGAAWLAEKCLRGRFDSSEQNGQLHYLLIAAGGRCVTRAGA